MYTSFLSNETPAGCLLAADAQISVEALTNADHNQVLSFLSRPSLQSAFLSGLIRDNGICSSHNRGTLYSYRNRLRELEGVALIGHATLMEVLTDRATKAFAEKAQSHAGTHLILCEENRIEKFWSFYATPGQQMRRASRQLLFELRWPIEVSKHDSNLRLATSQDLNLLIPVHAEMALDQSGTDPRSVDPKGFEDRYSRRISRGRTWVVVENGVLIFKAEVVSQTPETAYIEGVWVNPSVRRQGRGRSCLAQLSKMLLWRTKSLCMTVNDEHEVAQAFVKKSGYHLRSVYDSIFLT